MNKIVLTSFISLIILSGCSFKPDIPLKNTSFSSSIGTIDISQKWWEDFKDPYLNDFIVDVLENNSDLQIALNNIDLARANLGLSKISQMPILSYSLDATRKNNYPLANHSSPNSSYSSGFTLNYEIDFWGRLANTINASKSEFNATVYDFQTAKLTIISSAVKLYFQLKYLLEQEDVLKETIKNYEDSLKFRTRQLRAGMIDEMVVFQTQSQIESTKANLINIQAQILNVNNALVIMGGKNYDEILYNQVKTDKNPSIIPIFPSGIPSDILLKRSDVASALERLKASNFTVGAKKAEYFPKISLTGILGYGSMELSNLFNQISSSWSVAGSLAGPLFDFGATSRGVEIANLQQKAAFLSYDKALKTAFSEVKIALDLKENAQEQVNALNKLLIAQYKVYKTARNRFNQGYSDFLELLDAQRTYLSAKLNLIEAKSSDITSTVDVYKAFGGGFKLEDTKDISMINSNSTILPSSSLSPFSK